jgi:hypothetical protein
MAISFPRSLRALGSDRFRPSLVTLCITSLLLLVWFAWFWFASIPQYETSADLRVGRNGSVNVTLPAAARARVQPGQKATLTLVPPGQRAMYNGEVLRVRETDGTAELYFPELAQFPMRSRATVQIEIETRTPASLVLDAVRQSAASLGTASPTTTPTRLP